MKKPPDREAMMEAMEAWEIYYWVIAALLCFEALIAIIYLVVFVVTGIEATDGLKIIAGSIWCLTLILFIIAIVLSGINR